MRLSYPIALVHAELQTSSLPVDWTVDRTPKESHLRLAMYL